VADAPRRERLESMLTADVESDIGVDGDGFLNDRDPADLRLGPSRSRSSPRSATSSTSNSRFGASGGGAGVVLVYPA
jgi:hypothetical protein